MLFPGKGDFITCCFSGDSKWLVTAATEPESNIVVWNWEKEKAGTCAWFTYRGCFLVGGVSIGLTTRPPESSEIWKKMEDRQRREDLTRWFSFVDDHPSLSKWETASTPSRKAIVVLLSSEVSHDGIQDVSNTTDPFAATPSPSLRKGGREDSVTTRTVGKGLVLQDVQAANWLCHCLFCRAFVELSPLFFRNSISQNSFTTLQKNNHHMTGRQDGSESRLLGHSGGLSPR